MAFVRVGEAGKRLRIATSFNMSSFTALSLVFTKGDTSTQTVTPTLETGSVTMILDGTSTIVAANESVFYDFEPGDISSGTDGEWDAEFIYTNTGASPDDIFKNLTTLEFTVDP